jgi:phospholipid-binding lipoprotein MlaA
MPSPSRMSMATSSTRRWTIAWLFFTGFGLLAGCATSVHTTSGRMDGASGQSSEADIDPWESFNREITTFNDRVDELFAKPVAKAYTSYTPAFVRTSVSNFFFNLSGVPSVVNHLLQGKLQPAAEGVMRVSINTLLGFGGIVDIASEMNISRQKADLGQTLGRWGVPTGPYLVVPFLGPTTLRDAVASTLVSKDEVILHLRDVPLRNSLYALRAVEQRANLLRATNVLEGASLDPYAFTRDIFLQVRRNEVEGDQGTEEEEQPVPPDESPTPVSDPPKTDTQQQPQLSSQLP